VSNLGNIYILDIIKKEIVGIFKIHDESIISIEISEENTFAITCGSDGKVKLWKTDFTEITMEIQLDS
jgi:WD40 repeat protein